MDWRTRYCGPGSEEAILDRLHAPGREIDVGPLLEPFGCRGHGREASVWVWRRILAIVGKGKKVPVPFGLVVLDPGPSESGTQSDVGQLLAILPEPFANDHCGVVPWVLIPLHLTMDDGIS